MHYDSPRGVTTVAHGGGRETKRAKGALRCLF